jgi:hypothetical protein
MAHKPIWEQQKVFFAFWILLGLFFITPLVLFPLLFRKETEHLAFSLPLRRSTILLARYLTALTLLMVTFIASTLWSILVMVPINLHQMEQSCIRGGITDFSRMIPYYNDFWGFLQYESNYFFFIRVLSICSFVILGILALTRSFRYIFRWFSEFLSNFSALLLFIAFCWLGLHYLRPMGIGVEMMISSLIAGLLFFVIGLFLFEKYGEV